MSDGIVNLFPKIENCMEIDEVLYSISVLRDALVKEESSMDDSLVHLEKMKILIGILSSYHFRAKNILRSNDETNIVHIGFINDTLDNAKEAKIHFNDDYDMYVSYCSQWDCNDIKIRPIPKHVYLSL